MNLDLLDINFKALSQREFVRRGAAVADTLLKPTGSVAVPMIVEEEGAANAVQPR